MTELDDMDAQEVAELIEAINQIDEERIKARDND